MYEITRSIIIYFRFYSRVGKYFLIWTDAQFHYEDTSDVSNASKQKNITAVKQKGAIARRNDTNAIVFRNHWNGLFHIHECDIVELTDPISCIVIRFSRDYGREYSFIKDSQIYFQLFYVTDVFQ